LLYRKAGGMNEAEQQVGPTPKSGKTTIDKLADLLSIGRGSIRRVAFDIAVAIFFRVQLRRIFREWLDDDFRMIKEVGQSYIAGVNTRMIQDQNEAFRHEVPQMLNGRNYVLTIHTTIKMPLVNLARQSQAHGGGQHPAVFRHAALDWSLATRRPSAPEWFQKRVAEFVIKHDVYA
jgi:hypothetical protein